MPTFYPNSKFDAMVIGAGISGLTAAIHLQRAGLQTLVIERRSIAGGLCGTFMLDGFEFVTGCNDFGGGLVQNLAEVGVDIQFLTPRTRFHLGGQVIELPPNRSTMTTLARRSVQVLSAWRRARKDPRQTIGQLINDHLRDPFLMDAACIPVYAMMRSPDDVTIGHLRQDFSKELNYGHQKTYTPVGGPRAMIAAMVRRFEDLGGTLHTNSRCIAVERAGAEKRVHTSNGAVQAPIILSSQGRWEEFPPGSKPGIEIAFALFAVRKTFRYPRGYHTIAWFAPGLAKELRQLDAGQSTRPKSFHIFHSDLAQPADCYTINAIIPLPRGERDPSPDRRADLCAHIVTTIEKSLPGFKDAIIYQRFLSPADYETLVGLSSAPSPYVPPVDFEGLPSYDSKRDIYFIGTSVNPPGDHAGAACLSGKLAAGMAMRGMRH